MMFDASDYRFAQHLLLDSLVILFLVSGTAKFLGLRTFQFGLQLLPLFTAPIAVAVSIALPVAELFLALFLFLNFGWAKYAAISMLVLFCAIALLAVGMGRKVPCGCFGQLDGQTLSWRTVIRNCFLILIVIAVLGLERRTEWMLTLWPAGLFLLLGLSLVRVYRNHQLIVGLQQAKLL
jgi:hypothetical protein